VAKTLLRDYAGAYEVSVFEKSKAIGGLWPLSLNDNPPGKINPDLCVNLSRHTVTFSDFNWHDEAPSFPRAYEVGSYLEKYAERYELTSSILTECEVISASRPSEPDVERKWEIVVRRGDKTEKHSFHHLIVASGFFGETTGPDIEAHAGFSGKVLHSSQFRHVDENLLPSGGKGSKIVVVGGSMSGAEIAASVATQLSSDINSPNKPRLADASRYSVLHVVPRPFWVLPSFSSVNPFHNSEAGEKVC
jgi:cation diffusion facilitator CzcD-associated flavoprotein CzcO